MASSEEPDTEITSPFEEKEFNSRWPIENNDSHQFYQHMKHTKYEIPVFPMNSIGRTSVTNVLSLHNTSDD